MGIDLTLNNVRKGQQIAFGSKESYMIALFCISIYGTKGEGVPFENER